MTADLRAAKRDFTNAELLTLFATPVEMIPAAGTGTVIVPIAAVARLVRGTVAYSTSTNVFLVYQTDTINLLVAGSLPVLFANSPGGVLDQLFHSTRVNTYTGTNNFNPSNRAVMATLAADLNLGSASDILRVNVLYQVVPAAALGY